MTDYAHHTFDVDQPGKDSYRHRAAGCAEVLVCSSRRWALMHELRGAPEPPLAGLVRHLEQQADADARVGHAQAAAELRAKAAQNRQRLHSFIDAPPTETLGAMRNQVATYLTSLPSVASGGWVFGESISSADVVLAALCARLTMAGELALLQRADLRDWWSRYQRRPAFAAADVWTRFQRRRFLAAVLAARHTPIES